MRHYSMHEWTGLFVVLTVLAVFEYCMNRSSLKSVFKDMAGPRWLQGWSRITLLLVSAFCFLASSGGTSFFQRDWGLPAFIAGWVFLFTSLALPELIQMRRRKQWLKRQTKSAIS